MIMHSQIFAKKYKSTSTFICFYFANRITIEIVITYWNGFIEKLDQFTTEHFLKDCSWKFMVCIVEDV